MESTTPDPLKLENQLCFPLYACSKELVRAYSPVLKKLGLTYTQYISMLILWEHGPVTSRFMGEKLYLDSGTLTPLLKKLEAKGLITRTRYKMDERNLLVDLTDKGRDLAKAAQTVPEEMEKCTDLSIEEIDELYGLLYRILNRLRDAEEDEA